MLLSVAAVDLFPASWASWSIYYLARATKGIIWNPHHHALRAARRVRWKNGDERKRGERYRALIEFCNDLSPPFVSLSTMSCVEQNNIRARLHGFQGYIQTDWGYDVTSILASIFFFSLPAGHTQQALQWHFKQALWVWYGCFSPSAGSILFLA